MSCSFLDALCNNDNSVNFSASQLELGNLSAHDGDDDSVAAGLARVKPNAESLMQESAFRSTLHFLILFFFFFLWHFFSSFFWGGKNMMKLAFGMGQKFGPAEQTENALKTSL